MTDPVGKTNTAREKRLAGTKKAVAKKNTATATGSSSTKQSTVSDGNKKTVPNKPDSNTVEDLNSPGYPLHPERIWPD